MLFRSSQLLKPQSLGRFTVMKRAIINIRSHSHSNVETSLSLLLPVSTLLPSFPLAPLSSFQGWKESASHSRCGSAWNATMVMTAGVVAAGSTSIMAVASCQEQPKEDTEEEEEEEEGFIVVLNENVNNGNDYKNNDKNPFWPAGVDERQVDVFVEDCLNDPAINIRAIPDYLERQLYKSTIQLTLNIIYNLLGQLHGKSILAHELRLERIPLPTNTNECHLSQLRNDLDEHVLEQMAEQLLQNKTVNLTLIPDILEKQVYVNCLKIIFRLLDLLSATLCVSVCGHDFRLQITPSSIQRKQQQQQQQQLSGGAQVVVKRAKLAQTPLDLDLLYEYAAKQAGIDFDREEAQRSWYSKLFQPTMSREFVVQLHASLYGLVLGILDDILENSQLQLLNDQVVLDLDPLPLTAGDKQIASAGTTANQDHAGAATAAAAADGYVPFASFTLGVGVGLALMMVIKKL